TSTPNPSNPTYSNDLEGVVVASGGAGYMFEGTNGTFTASFNDAVSNGQLRQYAKGPYLDAWRGRVPVKDATTGAALPFMMATFYWESWKKNDGSFLCFRACAQICNSLTNTPAPAVSYTYDLDWKNGAAVIRGTSNQDRGFTTILHTVFANYSTFDHSARPDWSVNDAPLKAIIVQRDAARIDQFKHCGVVPPIIGNLSPTLPTPVTPFTSMGCGQAGTSSGVYETGLGYTAIYEPGASGVVKTYQPGGEHSSLGVLTMHAVCHIAHQRLGNYADAAAWLAFTRNMATCY